MFIPMEGINMGERRNYLGSKMKYVMDENGNFEIIPLHMGHDSAGTYSTKSAGFVQFYQYEDDEGPSNLGAECYGESVSLKKKSDPTHDSEIITRSLRFS
jgi:hypothetical protein